MLYILFSDKECVNLSFRFGPQIKNKQTKKGKIKLKLERVEMIWQSNTTHTQRKKTK